MMISNSFTGLTRPFAPTLADIQRRASEFLDMQQQLELQAQRQVPGAPATQPPAPASFDLKLDQAALYGVAGSVVRALAPHTEAHPAAIPLQLLAAFANAAGSGPHCMVDATRHGLNLFVVLVGESSEVRKGTSWNQIRRLFSEVDHPWVTEGITAARLTPAALIYDLRQQEPATDRRLLTNEESMQEPA
jgi:hypothetical protein